MNVFRTANEVMQLFKMGFMITIEAQRYPWCTAQCTYGRASIMQHTVYAAHLTVQYCMAEDPRTTGREAWTSLEQVKLGEDSETQSKPTH